MTDSEFIKVYQKYRNNVYSVIYHYVRNEADAADLQQEVFMKLYSYNKAFDSDEHQKAWLLRVAMSTSMTITAMVHH